MSFETAQEPLLIVHVNVYVPAIKPPTELKGEVEAPNVTAAGPDKNAQLPEPMAGAFPARMVLVTLHND